jgi:hypothetical protein
MAATAVRSSPAPECELSCARIRSVFEDVVEIQTDIVIKRLPALA